MTTIIFSEPTLIELSAIWEAMMRALVLICPVVALFVFGALQARADTVTVDLEYRTDTLEWELYALIVDTGSGNSGDHGLAALRALIDNIDFGTNGEAVNVATGIGAFDPMAIQTAGGTLDILYYQDTLNAPSVVGGVGVGTRTLIMDGTFPSAGTPPAFGDDDDGFTTDGNFLNVAAPGPFGAGLPWNGATLNILDVTPDPGDNSFQWNVNDLGSWTDGANWNPAQAPSTNQDTAIFGSVITAPRTVVADAAVTVKAVEFNNTNTYAIAGTGSVNLEADTGSAAIRVVQGTHEIQARMNLLDDTDADVAAGASLEFNNRLSLGGNTLTKDGAGALLINNDLNTGGGEIVVLGGTVGGGGTIGGDLVNSAGTVTPGMSPGILTVSGDYSQSASSILAIELAGTMLGSQHDQLNVNGTATLDGALAVSLMDSFTPTLGQTFEILSADSVSGRFASESLSLPALAGNLDWQVMYGASSVSLIVILPGDYNQNGIVDAADYTVWRDTLTASSSVLLNDPTPGTVDESDFAYWRAHFGETFGSGAGAGTAAAVPEPASLVIVLNASLAMLSWRARQFRQLERS